MAQNIIFTNEVNQALEQVLESMDFNKLFVLTDVNTAHFVLPKFGTSLSKYGATK